MPQQLVPESKQSSFSALRIRSTACCLSYARVRVVNHVYQYNIILKCMWLRIRGALTINFILGHTQLDPIRLHTFMFDPGPDLENSL